MYIMHSSLVAVSIFHLICDCDMPLLIGVGMLPAWGALVLKAAKTALAVHLGSMGACPLPGKI